MEMINQKSVLSLHDQVNKLCRSLGISEREKHGIFNNYQVSESEEEKQIQSIVRSYLRARRLRKRKFEEGFSNLEWVIAILFFENNYTVHEISLLVNESLTKTKLNFFAAKEKLLFLKYSAEFYPKELK